MRDQGSGWPSTGICCKCSVLVATQFHQAYILRKPVGYMFLLGFELTACET